MLAATEKRVPLPNAAPIEPERSNTTSTCAGTRSGFTLCRSVHSPASTVTGKSGAAASTGRDTTRGASVQAGVSATTAVAMTAALTVLLTPVRRIGENRIITDERRDGNN